MAKIKLVPGTAGMYSFFCPGCCKEHAVMTKQENGYAHPIWAFNGDVDKPTFSPSVAVVSYNKEVETRCHSFIREGRIEYLPDSDHSLAGQTIEMIDV